MEKQLLRYVNCETFKRYRNAIIEKTNAIIKKNYIESNFARYDNSLNSASNVFDILLEQAEIWIAPETDASSTELEMYNILTEFKSDLMIIVWLFMKAEMKNITYSTYDEQYAYYRVRHANIPRRKQIVK